MTSELIVDVAHDKVSIALLEDKRLAEFQQEGRMAHFAVGNIYLARVKKIMPGLNACFVNVGSERDAFLHYLDLGFHWPWMEKYYSHTLSKRRYQTLQQVPRSEDECGKDGHIQNVLKAQQQMLVQIVKEPISTKGPRLTCEISFAGRFLVLMPFNDKVNVSTKIVSRSERARLKQIVQGLKPKNVGIIIRTVAEGCTAADLEQEINLLYQRWENTMKKAVQSASSEKPTMVYEETSRAVGLLRDIFNPSFESIYVNDADIYREIADYVGQIAPDCRNRVKHYTGELPIFDNFNVTRQIAGSFGRIVGYQHGAYMYIESTEAMHVVDINSGNRSKQNDEQELNALDVNLASADELARQLRLRDMGGIIVVDFIDMAEPEHRQALYERMCENMQRDRAKHTILPLSKFGLMQITRQRVRPAMEVKVEESCPTCHGTGVIKSALLFTDTLESKVEQVTEMLGERRVTLQLHPFVYAFVTKGLWSLKRRWQMHYGWGLRVIPNQQLSFLQYRFVKRDGEEIDLHEVEELPQDPCSGH